MPISESARPLPEILVPSATINKRVRLFMQNKHPLLTTAMNSNGNHKMETMSVWYPKAHIETWLTEMNALSANGMRIYFGEYETEENEPLDSGKPIGQLCLLMVLTREGDQPGSIKNIIYENEPDFQFRKSNTAKEKNIEEGVFNEGDKSKQFNFGGYCPPICKIVENDYPNDLLS